MSISEKKKITKTKEREKIKTATTKMYPSVYRYL